MQLVIFSFHPRLSIFISIHPFSGLLYLNRWKPANKVQSNLIDILSFSEQHIWTYIHKHQTPVPPNPVCERFVFRFPSCIHIILHLAHSIRLIEKICEPLLSIYQVTSWPSLPACEGESFFTVNKECIVAFGNLSMLQYEYE